jgi:superfamily II DNA helicase RecQ
LYISAVARQGNGNQQILDFLEKHLNEQGIIYAQSRAKTESLAKLDEKNQNQKPLAMFVVYLPLLFFTS